MGKISATGSGQSAEAAGTALEESGGDGEIRTRQ